MHGPDDLKGSWAITYAYGIIAYPLTEHERRVVFPSFEWRLWRETRADAEKRILNRISIELKVQLDAISESASERALAKTPEKRSMEHFEWLARWQVGGESYRQIAITTNNSPLSVTTAIKELGSLIKLKPRAANGSPAKLVLR
jgi:hypothetical protein